MRCFYSCLCLLISMVGFGQTEKPKLEITHLTGDFYVYTTYKLYNGTPFPANGLYLVTNEGVVMIDTPWDETQFQPLLDSIQKKHHQKVKLCIATHSHGDRTGGLEYYKSKGIKTYTTKQTDAICRATGEKRAEFLLEKDTEFTLGQYTFETYYAGEGHTPDNIVVWFGKDKVLYGGCLVKSTDAGDLGNMANANVKAWPTTIKNIQRKYKPNYVIPGHQSWKSKKSLQHTLQLLNRL
ncbi:BlaB/IND/MUS family subclass B1 metallo-beta-lactamase [Flavobacterium terrisoli]|uniref:BlaB/IND/MUS family subclass B1 metallo-beta-lactamase n=1 Tax=Flavobacterium terrisoli TaxID=3242195 RepID=UPI0025437558|nr:BlaB/IND/MUS family subclass B1 metallo-beta-lactamase [Flavobacterium buctense]